MDILAQYDKQNPSQKQAPQKIYGQPSEDYGPIVQFIMRTSRGKIQNEQQANAVLGVAAIIMIIVALLFIFGLPGSSAPTVPLLRSAHPGIFIK